MPLRNGIRRGGFPTAAHELCFLLD